MSNQSLDTLLKDFIQLLNAEKEALINNDGASIQDIVSQKEDFISWLNEASADELDRETLIPLVNEVNELQETNLMLTQQAYNYTETVLSAFKKAANKNVTYSKDGKAKASSSNLLNQSL